MKGVGAGIAILSMALAAGGRISPAQASEASSPAVVVSMIPEDQQATKEQLAQLFDVMRVKQQMASMTRSMPAMMQQQFQQQMEQMKQEYPQMSSLPEDRQQAMKKVMNNFMERSLDLYPADEMIADLTAIYQKHLSQPDVEATIAFYSSPAGQHVLDMGPAMMQEFMPMVMQKTQDRMRPLIVEMSKQMAEIATSGAGKPAQK